MGGNVGEQFSHNSIRILPQSRRAPIERGVARRGLWQQDDFFQKQVRNMSLLQSQFKLYPNHMVLLKEGDSVTITFRDMNGLTTFLWNFLWWLFHFILESLPMSDWYCCALIGSVSRNQPTPGGAIRDVLLRDCNESSVALFRRGEGLSVKF